MTEAGRVAPRWWIALAGVLAAILLVGGFAGLLQDRHDDVLRSTRLVDGVPVTLLRPAGQDAAPGLIVAHGFAGSGVLMDGLGSAWARAGFAVALLDFSGHGSNTTPLAAQRTGRNVLTVEIDAVADWLRDEPYVADAPLQLVGHSMGAGAVVAAAAADRRYAATVALSLPSAAALPPDSPDLPANLLLLWGAAEQPRFADAALAALHAGYPDGQPGTRYGDHADGSAREAREVPGAEHLSILWRSDTAQWAYDWLAVAAGLPPAEVHLAPRMRDTAAVAMGILLALIPMSALLLGTNPALLPPPVPVPRAATLMVVAAIAASLSAAVAAPVTDLLPLAVGGHLALWFAGGSLALLLGARLAGSRPTLPTWPTVAAAAGFAGFVALALAVSGRMSWAPVALVGPRTLLYVLFVAVFLAWFIGDELAVRRQSRARRAGLLVLSRTVVIGALLAGVSFLGAPSFLVLLLPLMVPLLALLGAAAWILGARTASALIPAAVQAVPLALLVATTFPLLA